MAVSKIITSATQETIVAQPAGQDVPVFPTLEDVTTAFTMQPVFSAEAADQVGTRRAEQEFRLFRTVDDVPLGRCRGPGGFWHGKSLFSGLTSIGERRGCGFQKFGSH
jgi:hypothetical protein